MAAVVVASDSDSGVPSNSQPVLFKPPAELPKDTLADLRRIVGPFASHSALAKHAGNFPRDARKGANLYFRFACEQSADEKKVPFDFGPPARPLRWDGGSSDRANNAPLFESAWSSSQEAPGPPWQDMEANLFPAAGMLCAPSLLELSATSKALRKRIMSNEALWSETFTSMWGSPTDLANLPPPPKSFRSRGEEVLSCSSTSTPSCSPSPSSAQTTNVSNGERNGSGGAGAACAPSYFAFAKRWQAVKDRVCPCCDKPASIIPVVHGFPSTKLQVVQRRRSCMLAENCGFLGPFWICLSCRGEWDHYPFLVSSVCQRRQPLPGPGVA
mmetsp:Transcript_90479/g.198200  ORF Transcript_90479/g.198200 Transcript_90479/m.198200 type:complete len:328 (-) Transcript_90479:408-1391(-)